jgi:hypothetical protein
MKFMDGFMKNQYVLKDVVIRHKLCLRRSYYLFSYTRNSISSHISENLKLTFGKQI